MWLSNAKLWKRVLKSHKNKIKLPSKNMLLIVIYKIKHFNRNMTINMIVFIKSMNFMIKCCLKIKTHRVKTHTKIACFSWQLNLGRKMYMRSIPIFVLVRNNTAELLQNFTYFIFFIKKRENYCKYYY